MEINKNSLIEISGTANEFPIISFNFKEINYKQIINISNYKIKKINRCIVEIEIINSHITNSFIGVSNEGQKLKSIKLFVEGRIIGRIEYISNDIHNSIRTEKIDAPFYTDIMLNDNFHKYSKYKVVPYIEDIFISKISNNKVLQNILFIIDVTHIS